MIGTYEWQHRRREIDMNIVTETGDLVVFGLASSSRHVLVVMVSSETCMRGIVGRPVRAHAAPWACSGVIRTMTLVISVFLRVESVQYTAK
jgi:hypothetical protein